MARSREMGIFFEEKSDDIEPEASTLGLLLLPMPEELPTPLAELPPEAK